MFRDVLRLIAAALLLAPDLDFRHRSLLLGPRSSLQATRRPVLRGFRELPLLWCTKSGVHGAFSFHFFFAFPSVCP